MQVQRHIFGSRGGYSTLARSVGVTLDDKWLIETAAHSFGHTCEPGFGEQLAVEPAFFTTSFGSGRRGITCVRAAARSEEPGQSTLMFISAIVSRRDWDTVMRGDVGILLGCEELWQWDGSVDLQTVELPNQVAMPMILRQRVQRALVLISELEAAVGRNQQLVVSEEDFDGQDVRAVEMLIPGPMRRHMTTACRCLSPDVPCSLVCLAREARSEGITYRASEGVAMSDYAVALQEHAIASGVIPTTFVMTYGEFGGRQDVPKARPGPRRGGGKHPWWRIWDSRV
jgi:hypothetical protein